MTCPACGQHWCWICGRGFTDVSAHYSRLNLCGCPGLHMEGDYRSDLTNCTAQLKICGRRALLFLPMLPLILFYYPLAIAASPIVMAIRPSCEDVPPAHMVLKAMFIDPFEDSCAGVKWTLLGLVCLPLLPLLPIVCLVSYTCCKEKIDCFDNDNCCKGCNDSCDDDCSPCSVCAGILFVTVGIPLALLWVVVAASIVLAISPFLLVLVPCIAKCKDESVSDEYKAWLERLAMCVFAPCAFVAMGMFGGDDD